MEEVPAISSIIQNIIKGRINPDYPISLPNGNQLLA